MLDRGYAIVRRKEGIKSSVVRSSTEVSQGETVDVLLSNGALRATVEEHLENPLRGQRAGLEQN